jgi:hypothetical protein
MYWEILFDPNAPDAELGLQSIDIYKGIVQWFDVPDVLRTFPHTREISIIRRNCQDRSDFLFSFAVKNWIRQLRHDHYSYDTRLRLKDGQLIGAYKCTVQKPNADARTFHEDISKCSLDCQGGKLEITGLWFEDGENSQMVVTTTLQESHKNE